MRKNVLHERRGVSLMEILIAIFVIMIGLLGLTSLIPVGAVSIGEMTVADRTGSCGRAALRDVKVRRMLDPMLWMPPPGDMDTPNPELMPFAIDPLGVAKGMAGNLGTIERRTLAYPGTANPFTIEYARSVFQSSDDLVFTIPSNTDERAFPRWDTGQTSGPPMPKGDFSWFVTVCPADGESAVPIKHKTQYLVSVVVCHKRVFLPEKEASVPATFLGTGPNAGLSGGSIQLALPEGDAAPRLKEGNWILLTSDRQCKWYRVVTIGSGPVEYISLKGPDWDTVESANPTAVVIDGVVGVYTKPIELDLDPKWHLHQ